MSHSDDIYFVIEANDVGSDVGADGFWFHGEVVFDDAARYDACAHLASDGTVSFGDHLGMWASDALKDRMGGDEGLMGRVQAAIEHALQDRRSDD